MAGVTPEDPPPPLVPLPLAFALLTTWLKCALTVHPPFLLCEDTNFI